MTPDPSRSSFRFEKLRVGATLTLAGGETVTGYFFVADSASHDGSERIGELLNSETGFFPFEIERDGEAWSVLYNRSHLLLVEVPDHEERRIDGYAVAIRRDVSLLLSNGQRIDGVVRVQRPIGRDRVSDWLRKQEMFRYVEAADVTLIVNAAHVVSITEVQGQ